MMDKLKRGTKAWANRQRVHAHNSLIGSACMIKASCNRVIRASSTSEVSRKLAWDIKDLAIRLETSLRNNRIDPR